MIRTWTTSLAATLIAVASVAGAQTPRTTPTEQTTPDATTRMEKDKATSSSPDQQFVHEAAEGGLAEVELGLLGTKKASNSEVKQFAQQIVTDHTRANKELTALATQKGLHVPTEVGAMHKATVKTLEPLEGAAFDRAYMKAMVADHEKDVALFKQQSNNGKDVELKTWAGKTVGELQKHLELARMIEKKLAASSY